MKLTLLRIQQKNEFIYATKIKVRELKNYVDFNFRFPYIDSLNNEKESFNFNKYIAKLDRMGINVSYNQAYVQRKLSVERLHSIVNYINEVNNFMPNSIILACYNQAIEANQDDYSNYINPINLESDIYSIDLNADYKMVAIDGQHRLAGFFLSKEKEVEDMELPITILFGPSLSVCSKIFVDINGNQKPVDKSLIYDLTETLEQQYNFNRLKDKEIDCIKVCHNICKVLYSSEESPLYGQIRMLGTGHGSVSQAFLIENLYPLIYNGVLKSYNYQEQFNAIFYLLKSLQIVFPEDWPVLADESIKSVKHQQHIQHVLYEKKSQLSKTLGLGAFFIVFSDIFEKCRFNLHAYIQLFNRLKGRIIWSREEYESLLSDKLNIILSGKPPILPNGTNKAAMKSLAREILQIIN